MRIKLGAGTALKKKTVVALARQLAVDLWRWRTGRNTLEELGWVAAYRSTLQLTTPNLN